MPGPAPEQGSAALLHRRQEHRRAGLDGHRRAFQVGQRPGGKALAGAAHHRRGDPQRDPLAPRLHPRSRPRLPLPQPPLGHPLRRRKPTHPPGYADRQPPRQRALHPRRAQHRPPPTRQHPPHRLPQRVARYGQLGHRRGARQGHDAERRLRRRHGPQGGAARRRSRLCRHTRRDDQDRNPHLVLPQRPTPDRGARHTSPRQRPSPRASRRHGQQPKEGRRQLPAGHLHLRLRRLRKRQIHPHQRHPPAHPQPAILSLGTGAPALPVH